MATIAILEVCCRNILEGLREKSAVAGKEQFCMMTFNLFSIHFEQKQDSYKVVQFIMQAFPPGEKPAKRSRSTYHPPCLCSACRMCVAAGLSIFLSFWSHGGFRSDPIPYTAAANCRVLPEL